MLLLMDYSGFCKSWSYNQSLSNGSWTGSTSLVAASPASLYETNETLGRLLEAFQSTNDAYLLPGLACFGLTFFFVFTALLAWDRALCRSSYVLLQMYAAWGFIFLVMILVMIKLRSSSHKEEAIAYVSLVISLAQFMWTWLLYLTVKDVSRSVYFSYDVRRLRGSWGAAWLSLLLFLAGVILHAPLLPQLRMILHHLDPRSNPCVNPFLHLWDGNWDLTFSADLYFVVYFYLLHFLFIYAFPVLLIGCTNKDVIDLLHWIKNQTWLPKPTLHAANTAMSVCVLCNSYMVLLCPKMVVLMFGLFNHALHFLQENHPFFLCVNTTGNFLLVLFVVLTLPVMVVYNTRIRWLMVDLPCVRIHKTTLDIKENVQAKIHLYRKKRSNRSAAGLPVECKPIRDTSV